MDRETQDLEDSLKAAALRRHQIEDRVRLRSLRALSHMLPVLAGIYAAAALLFLVAPPMTPAAPHVFFCSLASGLIFIGWAVMRVDDPRFDTPISLYTISVAAGLGLAMFAVSGNVANTTTLAISVVATGALLYRFQTYLAMVAIVAVGWPLIARDVPHDAYVLAAFHLWASAVVGGLVLWSRRQLMVQLLEEAHEAEAMRQLATAQAQSLRRARDAALASAQAKGQFLANVSHEVRTPLNGMLGLLQLIDVDALPDPQDEYLRDVARSGRSLLAIVNDLLDLSKIEAGEMRLESVPFDVGTATREVVMNYTSAASAKGIALSMDIDEDVPREVCGDPLRLRQVLSNLLNNALKFTTEGEVSIAVHVLERTDTHVQVKVRVTDTGVGVSPRQAEQIFRPFSQADASTTREYGGTGLGLPICTQLVELMGGTLQLESTVGEGSTFSFSARFELEEQLSDELEAVAEGLSGLQVLLLESNHRTRETLNAQFQAWGMAVWTTTTFDGAMRTLGAPPHPDVTLIDLRSLGKSWRTRGPDLVQEANTRGSSSIVICEHRHEISEMLNAGVRVYVEKPIRRAKILGALLESLDRTQPQSPLQAPPERVSIPVAAPANRQSTGMRILVAEDNAINRTVITAHLDALGYEVDCVEDGEAVLEALAGSHPYAAVLMDGQMPKMDGYQATRAIREREAESERRRVPVVALTAHAMAGDRLAAFAAGMDDYLSKPFTQKQLQATLARWAARPDARTSTFPRNALDTTITAQLLDLEQEEPGFLCEVIDSFFETAEQSLARMKNAILADDLRAVHAAAHMVRGSGQQLGAHRFGDTCRKLEELTSIEGADVLVGALEGDLEGAREALTGL
ncbi:MAG: response regulator, partial [Polyangiales bacterium]